MQNLLFLAANDARKSAATRLRSNGRAVIQYSQSRMIGRRVEVLDGGRASLRYGNVQVTANADLWLSVDGRKRILKFGFSGKAPEKAVLDVVTQGLYEAAVAQQIVGNPSDVIFLDIGRGIEYRGARARSRITANIHAACANIEAIWPTVRPRGETATA